jgi:hypothetical protein
MAAEPEEGRGGQTRWMGWSRPPAQDVAMPPTFPPTPGSESPWGAIQTVNQLGPLAVSVTTASHGGVCVAGAGMAQIPEPVRRTAYSAGGWFEEDCDWAIPYLALGLHAFDGVRGPKVQRAAQRTVWRWHREAAALLGVDRDPDERG